MEYKKNWIEYFSQYTFFRTINFFKALIRFLRLKINEFSEYESF